MTTIRVIGQVDDQHRLVAEVPTSVTPGPVEVLIVVPQSQDDDVDEVWMSGIAREWQAELSDPREDIYTLNDGVPVDESR